MTPYRGARRPSAPVGFHRWMAATVLALLFALSGCASYSDSVRSAQLDLRAGQLDSAIEVINDRLDVDDPTDLPENLKKNRALLLLERATLLQAVGEYELSARDMMIADQRLDWLDLDEEGSVDLGKYIYSGSSTPYRAPAYERLLLNTLNMINFMVLRDFEDARVEARRFQIIAQFLVDEGGNAIAPQLLAAGNYLGGAAFEASREYDVAVRYYARAWLYGFRADELRGRLVSLVRVTGWKGAGIATFDNGLEDIVVEGELKGAMTASEYRRQHVDGQVLAVVQTGLVPYKVPERIPIGAALVYHSSYHHPRHGLSPAQRADAQKMALSGVLKFVNFPMLSREGLSYATSVALTVDGQRVSLDSLSDVADQVEMAYRSIAGSLIGAAILRMMVRAAAGGATRAGSQAIAKSNDQPAIGVLGWLAGLALEGALTAADVPDTRSWTTAPGRIWISRFSAKPGEHRLAVTVNGQKEVQSLNVRQDSLNVVNFSRTR